MIINVFSAAVLVWFSVQFIYTESASQQWHSIDKLRIPYPAKHTSCAVDPSMKKMYVFGGIDEDGFTNGETYRFNFDTLTWEDILSMPATAHGYRAAHVTRPCDSTVWYIGFSCHDYPDGSTWYFNLTDESWHDLQNGTVSYASTDTYYTNTSLSWNDTESLVVLGPTVPLMPTRMASTCCAYDNDRNVIYSIGGTYYNPPSVGNYTQIFNLTRFDNGDYENVWQTDIDGKEIDFSRLPSDDLLIQQACIYHNDSFYSIAGSTGPSTENTIYRLNVNEAYWEVLNQTFASERTDTIMRLFDGMGYIVGGKAPFASSRTYTFDFETLESRRFDNRLPYNGLGIAQCAWNDDTLISWGGSDGTDEFYDYFQIFGGMHVLSCLFFSSFILLVLFVILFTFSFIF